MTGLVGFSRKEEVWQRDEREGTEVLTYFDVGLSVDHYCCLVVCRVPSGPSVFARISGLGKRELRVEDDLQCSPSLKIAVSRC